MVFFSIVQKSPHFSMHAKLIQLTIVYCTCFRLEQELERLKQHLMTVEETYTQEALANEDKLRTTRLRLSQCEEQLRTASAEQSNTSKAASAHVQHLEARVGELTRECQDAKMKVFNMESQQSAHQRAMDNLNMALEGFQHEKSNDLMRAEKAAEQR